MKYTDCNWYDYPAYYDLAFKDETNVEAPFIQAVIEKHAKLKVTKLFEPACGSGRLLVALAKADYYCHGFDINQPSIDYLNDKINQQTLNAKATIDTMESFHLKPKHGGKFDGGFCTLSTFRHLHKPTDALSHLQCCSNHLNKGGIYVLGIHLITSTVDILDDTWDIDNHQDGVTVKASLRTLDYNKTKRIETLQAKLLINTPTKNLRLLSDYTLKTYTHQQIKALLAKVPTLKHIATYDSYDVDKPIALNGTQDDVVIILQKI